jgi:fatty acid synthase subunit beta
MYSDGKIQIDSPFSRLLVKPPVMVAGMTPSTVKAGFVSAILSAGYRVEHAGGGHYDAAVVRAKVAEIQLLIPPGVGGHHVELAVYQSTPVRLPVSTVARDEA